jgi:hypothetical protein
MLQLIIIGIILMLQISCHIVVWVWQKSMCLAVKGIIAGVGCQTLACAVAIPVMHQKT